MTADEVESYAEVQRPAGSSSGQLLAVGLTVVVLAFAAWSTAGFRNVEGAYLDALDVDLNAAAGALEGAAGETDALLRDVALLHGWLEEDEAVGSGALISALQRLSAAAPVTVPRRVHDDLLATGRYAAIEDGLLRRQLVGFYQGAARLESEPIEGQAALVAALDADLPLGAWRYVFGMRGRTPQPLSYEEAVRTLFDHRLDVPVRSLTRGLTARRVRIDSLHAESLRVWRAVRDGAQGR